MKYSLSKWWIWNDSSIWDGIIIPNNNINHNHHITQYQHVTLFSNIKLSNFPNFFLHKNIYIFTASRIRPCIWNTAFLGLTPACHYHLLSLSLINVSLWEPHGTQSCLQSFQEANNKPQKEFISKGNSN